MSKRSRIPSQTVLVSAILLIFACSSHVFAQSSVQAAFTDAAQEPTPINVLVGQSRVINFDRAIGRFSVSNPEIAEAVLVAPDQVLVNGKAFGQVNFIAWEQKGSRFVVFDVFVRTNLSLIDAQIRALFPKDDIRLSQANGSVVLSGNVKDAKTVEQVEQVVQAAGFKTVNMLQSPAHDVAQVQLQVRVAEVSRSRAKDLGGSLASANNGTSVFTNPNGPASLSKVDGGSMFETFAGSAVNLFLFNSAVNTQAFIHALKSQGALRELAEPNLIAMDGQQASFLAGGEFPVPVVSNNGERAMVTVMFKEYGVRLNFKPTIIDEDHIRLELEPEVSTIDFANGVKFDGFLIPALRTRRAKTGVELRDGQSFALAGLLDNSEVQSFAKVPVLGDIPVLGTLFKSKSFQKQETELMFVITAQLVKPVNRDDVPQMRGLDGLKKGSPLGVEPKGEGIQGPSGFSTGSGVTSGGTSSVAPAANTNATTSAPAVTSNAPAAQAAPATQTTSTDATSATTKADAPAQQASVKPQP